MKNLSYFLWLCVVSLAGYVGFDIFSSTVLRTQDYLALQQMERALDNATIATNQENNQTITHTRELWEVCGDTYQTILLNKIIVIDSVSKNYQSQLLIAFQNGEWEQLNALSLFLNSFISSQDTTLREFEDWSKSMAYCKPPKMTILQNLYFLHKQSILLNTELKAIEKLSSRIGCVCQFGFEQIKAQVISKTKIVNEKDWYTAHLIVSKSENILFQKATTRVQIGQGQFEQFKREKQIENLALSPVFNKQGICKENLELIISFKTKKSRDTTIYLSTTYTVKRKK